MVRKSIAAIVTVLQKMWFSHGSERVNNLTHSCYSFPGSAARVGWSSSSSWFEGYPLDRLLAGSAEWIFKWGSNVLLREPSRGGPEGMLLQENLKLKSKTAKSEVNFYFL